MTPAEHMPRAMRPAYATSTCTDGRTDGLTEMHPTSGDHLPTRNAHENDDESIDTSPAGAPRQAQHGRPGPELARTALHAALTHQETT